jgi:hypothetical protein
VDRNHRVAGVVLAAEQARLLQLGQPLLDRAQLRVELGGHLLVFSRHLGEVIEVGDVRLQPAEHLQAALRPRMGRRGAGSGLLVVPEAGTAHLLLQPRRFGL